MKHRPAKIETVTRQIGTVEIVASTGVWIATRTPQTRFTTFAPGVTAEVGTPLEFDPAIDDRGRPVAVNVMARRSQ
jgi:hypothetical protein